MTAQSVSPFRGVTRLEVLIPALAAPLVVGLAATGSFSEAVIVAALAIGLPRATGRSADVRLLGVGPRRHRLPRT